MNPPNPMMLRHSSRWEGLASWVLLAVSLAALMVLVIQAAGSARDLTPAYAAASMVVVAVLPLPAEAPAMLIGNVFNPVAAVLVTWSAALLGAAISFELARLGGRPLVQKLLPARWLTAVDARAAGFGWTTLLVLRLIPLVAFTALNWGAGLTPVRRWTFYWTTAVGILPGAAVFTLTGRGLGALYVDNPALSISLGVGLVLALVVAALVRRSLSRRAAATAPKL